MHRIRNLTLLAVAWGLLLSTMVGSVSVDAAVQDAEGPSTLVNPTESTTPTTSASEDISAETDAAASSSYNESSIPVWILWPLGFVELWLVGWIGVWSVALVGARRFLFEVDSSLRNVTFGRIPFGGGSPLTLAHLTLSRAFVQNPWVADEWLNRHSQAITDWLSIDSRRVDSIDRDILVRIDGQAIAIADAPTIRAIVPETPFVLALHGEGRQWNERVLNIVLGQSMHPERGGRLMSHRSIPVVLDRNCIERFQSKGKPSVDMPFWLQVVRNELCRVPGLAVSLDDELLLCLVQSRRILPIVDQWSQTPSGFQNALQTAVSSGELPCLVVIDDSDTVAEMNGVIRARSLKSPEFVAPVPTRVPASATKIGSGSTATLNVNSPLAPRTFDKHSVPLLVRSLDDSVADVRVAAAQTLGGLGTSAREAVSHLTTLLNDPVTACRQAAVNALGAIGPDAAAATESLTKATENDHRKVRAAACRTLGAIGRPDGNVLKALVAAMNDKDATVRAQAARSLGGLRIGRPDIVTALVGALSDESAEVRTRAVGAISAIPDAINESVSSLVAALADPVAEVRRDVVAALGNVSRSRGAITQILAHSLTDPDSETRSRAAASLSRFGQESRPAIPQLARLVGDSVAEVRRSAVEALDSIGVPSLESVSALEEATRDTDESVRSAAMAALERAMPVAAAA